jgi:hypothetical protein
MSKKSSMDIKKIESRLIQHVVAYVDVARRFRRAALQEADLRRSSLNMVDMLTHAGERARLESLARHAEGQLFILCDDLDKACAELGLATVGEPRPKRGRQSEEGA